MKLYTLFNFIRLRVKPAWLIFIVMITCVFYKNLTAQSCCCTGAGCNYSILPDLDKNIVGMRYSYASYSSTTFPMTTMNMGGTDMTMQGPGVPTSENMHTFDAFARFALPKHFYISAFIPVHVLEEQSSGGHSLTTGLGDISVLVQYAVFNDRKCTGKIMKHQLRLGVGIKAPTGHFSMTPDGMFLTDLQLGTGSFDFLLNGIYTLRYKQAGFNLMASYKKNLANSDHFRFGDKLKGGASAFYIFRLPGNISVMPQAGLNYDYVFYNVSAGQALNYTGGQYLTGKVGLDIYYGNIALSASVSPPLVTILNCNTEPYERMALEAGVYYSFSKFTSSKKYKSNEIVKAN